MNHDNTIQSNWRTVASCLASQNYISIVKGLVHHFTAIDDEEILDKIYEEFINDDSITTVLNNDLQTCLLYTSPSPRDKARSRMPSSA